MQPQRVGRSGDRVVNTPCSRRWGSFRGRVRSTSRRARCSQVSTSSSSPTRRPSKPGNTCGSSTNCARGAPSSPWRGASAGSRNGDRTKPITCSSRRCSSSTISSSSRTARTPPLEPALPRACSAPEHHQKIQPSALGRVGELMSRPVDSAAPDEDRSGGFERGGWTTPLVDNETGTYLTESLTHRTIRTVIRTGEQGAR